MPVKSSKNKKRILLKVSGNLTVEQAGELHQSIQKAMDGPERVIELDLSDVTEADISGLQVLCSAHKSSMANDKTLSITKLSPAMGQAVADAGFHQNYDCSKDKGDSCLWLAAERPGQ